MDLFLIKLFLSFVVGTVWITSVTVFADRFGPRLGGVLAGIPATLVVSLFFIGWSQSTLAAVHATSFVPLLVGVNALFAVLFVALARRSYWFALGVSLAFWFAAAFLVVRANIPFTTSLVLFLFCMLATYVFFERVLRVPTVKSAPVRYTRYAILSRGILAGVLIVASVLAARFAGPVFGGVFASFPVLTIALILIVHKNSGPAALESLLKHFIITSPFIVVTYAVCVRYTYDSLGLLLGTLLAFAASIVVTYVAYRLITKRLR